MSTPLDAAGHRAVASPPDPLADDAAPAAPVTPSALGVVGAALALLAGGWLMYAPFAFGYQPDGADWTDATSTDFWDGFGLAILGLIGLVVAVIGLVAALRANGALTSRSTPEPAPEPEPAAPAAPASSGGDELTALLRPLIAALERDNAEQAPAHTRPQPTYQER